METNNLDRIISRIKRGLSKYADAGHIDENELYMDAIQELKRFGNDICIPQEVFLEVNNGRAKLPDQFFSLQVALECQPDSYENHGVQVDELQQSLFYRERTVVGDSWSECDSCCSTRQDNVVRENIYFSTGHLTFNYAAPKLLRLAKGMEKSLCDSKCRNSFVIENPNEISIIKKTLQANFDKGTIYMQYKGLPISDDGAIDVPETKNGHLEKYIEYFLRRRLVEDLMGNSDAQALQNLYSVYDRRERESLTDASNELKMSKINPVSLRKIHRMNRLETLTYEVNLPLWL